MIADSTNTDPLFFSDPPDWSLSYSFAQIWQTVITKAKNSAEQRSRQTMRARYALQYTRAALTIAESSVRRSEMLGFLGAPGVFPIWHAFETLLSKSFSGLTFNLDTAALLLRPFKIGSYAYIVQTGFTSVFREIESIATNSLTFVAGNAAFPDIPTPAYTAGAKVYPCILGVFSENGTEFIAGRHDQTDQIVSVIEL